MPAALTLHAIDEKLSTRLSSYAQREKKSLNQSAKELLASALGIAPAREADHSAELERFIGAWDDETADRLRENLENFEQIDEARWQ